MADGPQAAVVVGGGLHGGIDRLGHDVAAYQVADVVDQQAQAIRGQTAQGFRKRLTTTWVMIWGSKASQKPKMSRAGIAHQRAASAP